MNKSKVFSIILSAITVVLICFGIGAVYYSNHIHDKEIASVSATVSQYLSDKYGAAPGNLEYSDKKYQCIFDNDYRQIVYRWESDGKYSYAMYLSSNGNAVCCDDHQWDDISAAAEEYFNNTLGGRTSLLRLNDSGIDELHYYYLMGKDNYFDGSNIESIIKNSDGSLQMLFVDRVFSDEDFSALHSGMLTEKEFVSFDTEEHMNLFLKNEDTPNLLLYSYPDIEKYSPYITDYLKYCNGDQNGYDINIMTADDFSYAYFPVEERKLSSCSDVKAEQVRNGTLTEKFGYSHEESWIDKPISPEYSFNSSYGDVWIYWPLEKLAAYNIDNIGFAWFSDSGFTNNRNIEKPEIIGDYAVFHLKFGGNYFMLVDMSGKEEYVPGYLKENKQ